MDEIATNDVADSSELIATVVPDLEQFEIMDEKNASNSSLRCVDDQVSTPSEYQTAIFFTLAFVTVTFNLFLIVVVLKTKNLRKKTNYIIVSMAGADLLVGLISEPLWGLALWVEDKRYITTATFVVHFALMSSVAHLLIVTVERTVAVLKPLHYRAWVTCKRVQITVACTWLWSLFVASLHPFLWKSYSYYLFIVWTGFLVLVIVAILHCLMLRALRIATNELKKFSSNTTWYYRNQDQTETSAVRNARLREKRKTKLVSIITIVFAVCVLPSVASETMCFLNVITQVMKNSINLLFFLNSFMNPIIFAFREPKFRMALKTMCGCFTPKSGGLQSTTPTGSRDNLRLHPSRSDTSDINGITSQNGSAVILYTDTKIPKKI